MTKLKPRNKRNYHSFKFQLLPVLIFCMILIIIFSLVAGKSYRDKTEKPKIEVVRTDRSAEIICDPDELFAIVSDIHLDVEVPQFGFEDSEDLVDLIENKFLSDNM